MTDASVTVVQPFVVTWSVDDIDELKRRVWSDQSTSRIAKRLGRTEKAIRNKLYELGLRIPQFWTVARTEKLLKLTNEKLSATQISKELGCTRNAVIGKWHREGMKPQSGLVNGKTTGPRKSPSEWQRRPRRPRLLSTESIVSRFDEPTELLPDVSPFSVSIADLQPGHCRWPVSGGTEFMYCGGGKVEGCSYCRRHRRIAFVQPRYVRQAPQRFSFAKKQRWRAT